ncbi:MAG: polysaccharide deacetylase family protein [Pseudomonadota bacterium]
MPIGLRIDVDTLRGTRIGVPNLIDLLDRHRIRATFFFSVGPDNMGRHLWRMARPAFMIKMLRTRAASLYGWDILLKGTFWPGPVIGKHCPVPIRGAARAGHEIGFHAWDHHLWQTRVELMGEAAVGQEIAHGWNLLSDIIGRSPDCAAAPGWRITPAALGARERFPSRFNSDCRGHAVFRPILEGKPLSRVQVPTTLPTYDEMIGRRCTPATYNETLLEMIRPERLNVLTLHAEAEGIACLSLFQDFLERARRRKMVFLPLGDLLAEAGNIRESRIRKDETPGREGWLSRQEKEEND